MVEFNEVLLLVEMLSAHRQIQPSSVQKKHTSQKAPDISHFNKVRHENTVTKRT